MAQKIMIASGKGGVGKSSLTAGLARALSDMGKKVLMLDMDIGLRSLDLIFGVQKDMLFDWGDIISNGCDIENATVWAQGPNLITAPMHIDDSFTNDKIKALSDYLSDFYDYIIYDAPAGLSFGFNLACAAADRAIVVSTMDEVCVRSVNLAASMVRKSGIEDIRLVINRFDEKAVIKGKLLNIDDVIDATCVRLIGVVPEDNTVSHCAVRGVELPRKCEARLAFERIAKRIEGENIPLFG